jgi:lipid-A-disaccharide synthase
MKIAIVAGEASGDELGYKLMAALKRRTSIDFIGVGGPRMEAEGLSSFFPMADIAVMGILPVIKKLPTLLARIRETAEKIVAAQPDALVIIDSPDFTHRVAKRVRKALPHLAVVDYVSPSVWAWRPGRAKAMRAYVDHVLALLPFEPAAHQRLNGPVCTYVGHPLTEILATLRSSAEEEQRRSQKPYRLLVLPGSRRSEIRRLLGVFGETVAHVARSMPELDIVLPAVPHLHDEIVEAVQSWPVKPLIVTGIDAKYEAFRTARAALAASGTVTLELALAQVPTVVAYKVSKLEEQLKYLITVSTIVLPNLILGENAVPEFLQADANPEKLSAALIPLLGDTPERAAQMKALTKLDDLMRLPEGTPSEKAAAIVLETAGRASR